MSIGTKLLKLIVHNNNNERRKLEWRRAHYSETNHGPLTRLTLLFVVLLFIKTQKGNKLSKLSSFKKRGHHHR